MGLGPSVYTQGLHSGNPHGCFHELGIQFLGSLYEGSSCFGSTCCLRMLNTPNPLIINTPCIRKPLFGGWGLVFGGRLRCLWFWEVPGC